MGKVQLIKGFVGQTLGGNMAARISRFSRKPSYNARFDMVKEFQGSKQVLNGQKVVKGRVNTYDVLSGTMEGPATGIQYDYLTQLSQSTKTGKKTVSRMVPRHENNYTAAGDITKITETSTAQVGAHEVRTFHQKAYEYNNNGLDIREKTIDRLFAGKKHLGGRAEISTISQYSTSAEKTKVFFGPDGAPLKTVHYSPKTGLRTYAELPDGRIINYDAKGLPVFTDARGCCNMDLGGLDKLI